MLHAHFIHKLETGKILALQRLDKRPPQGYDPPGVAFGGMDALFFRRHPNACTARHRVDWLTAGPPMAANQVRNSASVASGSWRRQARNSSRARASRSGAGPLRGGRAATWGQGRHRARGALAMQQLFHKRSRNAELGGHRQHRAPGLGAGRRDPLTQIK